MADRTYTVTVASGELYIVGGTGNVFYLDGVRDLAIEWVEGGTLRFSQDDSSNNNHPLLFTTSTLRTLKMTELPGCPIYFGFDQRIERL